MVHELAETFTGEGSHGQIDTFKSGEDARILRNVQEKLLAAKPTITKQDKKAVLEIYRKFFRTEKVD